MTSWSWSDGKGYTGTLTISETSHNVTTNSSQVLVAFSYSTTSGYDQYTLNAFFQYSGDGVTWTTLWQPPTGAQYPSSSQYALGANGWPSSQTLYSNTHTFYHDPQGNGTMYVRAKLATNTTTYYTPNLVLTTKSLPLTYLGPRTQTKPTVSITRTTADPTTVSLAFSSTAQNGGTAATGWSLFWSYPAGSGYPAASASVGTGANPYVLTGVPDTANVTISNVTANNDAGTSTPSDPYIAYAPPIFNYPLNIPGGFVAKPYGYTVSAKNVTTYSVTSGTSLPAGLSLSSSGTISGTPTTTGTSTFTIDATNGWGTVTSSTQTISVLNSSPLVVIDKTKPLTISGGGVARSTLKVRVNNAWVPAYMRIFDNTYTNPADGTFWHPVA